jgi:aminocarboxymuconate-semialdehyde decarboxylase
MADEKACCGHGISRRTILRTGLAAAVSSVGSLGARPTPPPALKPNGVRAVDIHAHYYPQPYLDVIQAEGPRFNAEYRMTDKGFFFRTVDESDGPLPMKFIDLSLRLADTETKGVAIQALSLTYPMVYWADGIDTPIIGPLSGGTF